MSKTIIVLVDEESDKYSDEEKVTFGDSDVITIPIGENGDKIRGYVGDVVLIPEDMDQQILNRIVRPIVAVTDGEILRY